MKKIPFIALICTVYTVLFFFRFFDVAATIAWSIGIFLGSMITEIESMARYSIEHRPRTIQEILNQHGFGIAQRVTATPIFLIAAVCASVYMITTTTQSVAHGMMFGIQARIVQEMVLAWRADRLEKVSYLHMFQHSRTEARRVVIVYLGVVIAIHLLYFL